MRPHGRNAPGFGSELKRLVRETPDAPTFWMGAFGEMLPRYENRVSINKDRKDAWGIPVAHIECAYSDNEREMAKDQLETMKEMVTAAGWEIQYANPGLSKPGLCIHEVGTARMGADPKTSVLNKFNQSWDVKNLFITDGSCFVSQGCQNPTLTMMALTVHGFADIVSILKALADELCPGKLVLTLEGGYNLKAIAYGVKATFDTLLGNPIDDPLGRPQYGGRAPSIDQLLNRLKETQQLG